MEVINQKLGVDNREKITAGQVIKALILNGLGIVSRPFRKFKIETLYAHLDSTSFHLSLSNRN